jgi:phosphate transport system substrate-binding protein
MLDFTIQAKLHRGADHQIRFRASVHWLRWSSLVSLLISLSMVSIAEAQSRPAGTSTGALSGSRQTIVNADQAKDQVTQSVNSEQAAADKLLSMLMAIDPYCPSEELTGKLPVFGTPTMGALADQWAQGFNRFHSTVEIEISEMKGQSILNFLTENPHGVAMIARPLSNDELDAMKKGGLKNPMQVEVGQQALGVFVHESNPMTTVTQEQFLNLFSAGRKSDTKTATKAGDEPNSDKITWGDLGLTGDWKDKPVHLIFRESASGTHSFLKNQLLGEHVLRQPKETFQSSTEVLQAIAADPFAIGLSNLRSPINNVRVLTLLDGKVEIPCSDLSILTGEYPLVRRITLIFDAGAEPEQSIAQEFVKYAICQDGQRETILSGFFPLDVPLLRAQLHKIERGESENAIRE